ncbi:MAG: AAA family ATPase [Planctomycetes bacterium]|nr:AAA family ATPase [Planctomycetota bacterium]
MLPPLEDTDPLLDARVWRAGATRVARLETHISRLYFVGERVFKLKKSLVLPFLDYGTLERRRQMCEEELRLNRRLAPQVYVRIAPLARRSDGALELDGPGEVVEWVVEMRRLPAERMLDALLERGEFDNSLVRQIAEFLADFHARCARGERITEFASPQAVARNARDNLTALAEHAGGRGLDALSDALLGHLRAATERDLTGSRVAELLAERATAAHVCDGHGDLHAGNLCLTDGEVIAYDCIEFSEAFRCGDVASELAFLCMDLDFRGYRGFSSMLAHEYATRAADTTLLEVLDFYKTYRALVRSKVALLRARERRDDAAFEQCQDYLHLAASYSLPPVLILTCGLPASGKSWLAPRLAAPFEAVLLSSDVRRRRLAVGSTQRLGAEAWNQGLYSPTLKERTYDSLLASAREALQPSGSRKLRRSVVVDANFPSAVLRGRFRALARELGAPFVLVHAHTDETTARARLAVRTSDPDCASDADWEVFVRARAAFEPPTELAASEFVEHASPAERAADTVGRVLERIVTQQAR